MLVHSAAQVGTSATLLAAAQSTMNRWVAVQNLGPNDIYVGGPAVTATTGLKILPTETLVLDRFDGALHAICAVVQVSPADTRVLVDTD